MSQVFNLSMALQLLRAEAEASAHLQHLKTAREHLAGNLHQLQELEATRDKLHELHPTAFEPHLQHAYDVSMKRAEIEWLYWVHRQALSQKQLNESEFAQSCAELQQQKEQQLAELPALPALNLSEQEALLQALMCQAAEQYVDSAIQDSSAA